VVKIGLVAPFEGRYRSLGYEVLHAVKLVVHERNAAGGAAGFMIELVALDDNDDPCSSALQAKKFAVDEQVMGVVGPFSDLSVQAVAPVYHGLGLPVITPATCSPLATYSEVYCLGADADTLARALLERVPVDARVTLLRSERASPDRTPVDPGCVEEASAHGEVLAGLAQGSQQVLTSPWNETTLEAMRKTPVDIYLYAGDVLEAADLLVEMRQAGIDAPFWGGPGLARIQLAQIAGDSVAGACHGLTDSLLADPSAAAGSEFADAYQELAGTAPGPWAALAYDASVLLLDAMQKAVEANGRPTREGVTAALADVRGPEGELVFEQGRRRQAKVTLYCYQAGDSYPGSPARQGRAR